MIQNIYVVVGHGSSDIGKGWLAGSIASILPRTLPIKIDPMLNVDFPSDVGTSLEGVVVSDDLATYNEVGLSVHPEYNIMSGALFQELLRVSPIALNHGRVKKRTFADLSELLAEMIFELSVREDPENIVIEVGGIISNDENAYIPGALRSLGLKTGTIPEMIVLSYLEFAETDKGKLSLKTQNPRQAVQQARMKYSLPIKACFVRRRSVPGSIEDDDIRDELVNIAHECQMPANNVVYLPNVVDVHELREYIDKTSVFSSNSIMYIVSSCLLGVPCRYDGTTEAIDQKAIDLLRNGSVLVVCPELLADLPVPRGPFEIISGDGYDVLDGNAQVIDREGHDFTEQFVAGARRALEIAQRNRVREAILYHKSPSCGCDRIYDGSFTKNLKPGFGVFAALLDRNGIKCTPNTKL